MTTDYGFAISCTDDLNTGRRVTGATLVAEALYRRLTTRRGTLLSDPNYGLDLEDMLQDDITPAQLATLPGRIRLECAKDPRVLPESIRVEMQVNSTVGPITGTIRIRGELSNEEPFALVIKAPTAELLKAGTP